MQSLVNGRRVAPILETVIAIYRTARRGGPPRPNLAIKPTNQQANIVEAGGNGFKFLTRPVKFDLWPLSTPGQFNLCHTLNVLFGFYSDISYKYTVRCEHNNSSNLTKQYSFML